VGARIKEELLADFRVNTIVRLPNGVFSPYTPIPTNVMFFDRSGPTESIWFYEHPLPEGRKNYTKTKPLRFEEFTSCLAWWSQREEDEHAWLVSSSEIAAAGFDMDIKNPRKPKGIEDVPPDELTESILGKEQEIAELLSQVQALLPRL